MRAVDVAKYDDYMLINSYLAFFVFPYDNVIAVRCLSINVITFGYQKGIHKFFCISCVNN